MKRVLGFIVLAGGLLHAQSQTAFEVATVKPSDPAAVNGGIKANPGGQTIVASNVNLRLMIRWMYKITDDQIVSLPQWGNDLRWDVQGKAEHAASREEWPVMFQTLAAERFELKFHKETRTLPALVLSVDKSGSKMKLNDGPDKFEISMTVSGPPAPPAPMKWHGNRCSMQYLAWWLSQQKSRPVVDQTGLPGYYDFTLEFAPEFGGAAPNGATPPTFDGPALFDALRQQLGLKVESAKAPVEVYVIDHVAKP